MIRTKVILGLALAASIASLGQGVDAAPIAASRAAVAISADGMATPDVIRVSTHPTRRHRHRNSHHHHHHHGY